MSTDPVVRYASAGVLLLTFAAALTVTVHGYWSDPSYQIPALISYALGSAITGALTLLGVHLGTEGAANASAASVDQTARVIQSAQSTAANGATNGNGHMSDPPAA